MNNHVRSHVWGVGGGFMVFIKPAMKIECPLMGEGIIVHYNMPSSESQNHVGKSFDIISYKCRVKPLCGGAGSSNRTYAKSGMSPTCGLLRPTTIKAQGKPYHKFKL